MVSPAPPPASLPRALSAATFVWPVRVLGLGVALLLLLLGSVSVLATFFHRTTTTTVALSPAVTSLLAEVDTGTVRVRPVAPGETPRVRITRSGSFRTPTVTQGGDAAALRLTGRCADGWTGFGRCSVRFDVLVKPGTRIEVTSSTGSIDIADADGDVRASTSTGRIRLTGLRSPRMSAQTSTGEITARFAAAPREVRAHTATGSVDVTVPDDGTRYRVSASASVGTSRVAVPDDPNAERVIDVSTSVGSVRVHH